MSQTGTKSLCSRCERFDIQAFGRSRYPYQRLSLSTAVQSAEKGCSFCRLLVENLASRYDPDGSWLSRVTTRLFVQLKANKDHIIMDSEEGGMSVYQITASLVRFSWRLDQEPAHFRNLDINVSADPGKSPITSHVTKMLHV